MIRNTFAPAAVLLVPVLVLAAAAAGAQSKPDTIAIERVVASSASMFRAPRDLILRSAEKMPEDGYSFQPTPEVRTFAQLLGHVADGYRLLCSLAVGDSASSQAQRVENNKSTKTELIAALKETSAICDRAHETLSGPKGGELIEFGGGEKSPRFTVLFFNNSHAWEHYGNVVTYLRLRGIVPPSSEPGG